MDTQELAQKKARIKKDLKILQAIKAKWRPQKERFPVIYQGFKDQEKSLVDQYNELKKLEKGPAGPKKEKEREKASTEKKASKKEEPKKEEPKKEEEKITVSINEDDDDDFESDDEWNEMDIEIKEEDPAKKKEEAKKLPPVDIKADTISDEDALTLEKDNDEFESDDDDDEEEEEDWEEMEAEGEKKGAKTEEEEGSDKSSKKKLPFAKGATKPASKPILKKGGDPKGSEDKDKLKALAKGLKKRTKK